ncbi:MAG: chemotaxis protein CheW, partial [Actinomycetota bacterium]
MAGGAAPRTRRLVPVMVAGEVYALPAERVREVVGYSPPSPLPRSEAHVRGVIDVGGEVVPVVSARVALGLPDAAPTEQTRIVVTDAGGGATGLVVDAVAGTV